MENLRKTGLVDTNFKDRSDVFIQVNSPRWRAPQRISIEQLIKDIQGVKFPTSEKYNIADDIDNETLIIDKDTLKVKVASPFIDSRDIFYETFDNQHIDYNKPPQDASTLSGMHLMTDGNYLYIWINDRWKRTPLSEW